MSIKYKDIAESIQRILRTKYKLAFMTQSVPKTLPEAQGLPVGSCSSNSIDNSWLVLVVYYGNKSRVIRTFVHNLYGQIEMMDTEYNHAGEVLQKKKIHKNQNLSTRPGKPQNFLSISAGQYQ